MAANFTLTSDAWPSSGTATAGTTGMANVGSNWTHGQDADGNYLEHAGNTTTTDVLNPILETEVSAFLNGGGLQTYRHTHDFKVTGGDGSAAAVQFNAQLYWFSGWMFYLRHVESDGRERADGSVSHVRLYASGGSTVSRNSTGYVFIPTDTKLTLAVEVEETAASVFTMRAYLNGELFATAAGVGINAATAARVMEIRSVKTGTGPEDCKLRVYGPFSGEENPATLAPDASAQVSPVFRHLPAPLDDASGYWTRSGGVGLGVDVDDLNGGGGVPQIPLATATIPSGGVLRTRAELGTLRTNDAGAGAVVFPAVVVNDATARLDLELEAPGGASVLAAVRFDPDGTVKGAAGSGALLYATLTDQDAANLTWTAGEVYELAVHFAPGKRPSVVLHNRSATFAGGGAAQTIAAAELVASAAGVPTLGHAQLEGGATGSSNATGLLLAAHHWLGLVSSWVHSTGSPYGGGAHLLTPVNPNGFGLSWGNELPGLEPAGDRPNELSALGRSGADLADWETTNPAWADLLPLMPAARFYFADTMVNHLVAQRTNGAAAIAAAATEVLDQVGRFIDAAKANGVLADFMAQQPLPTGGTPNGYPAEITAACSTVNAGVEAALDAAGRPDLFTWADIIDGQVEADFYNAGVDDTHYSDAGDELAFLRSVSERLAIGTIPTVSGSAPPSTRRRRR